MCGYLKDCYDYMFDSLFFEKLFDVFFNAYFAFIFVSMLAINSDPSDENHHSKLLIFSWILMIICVFIVPGIVCYAAL